MKTTNRPVKEVAVNGRNNFKFFNQMDFKGIIQDKNIFEVDQRSFEDVENVYVDSDNSLKSRKPLIQEALPSGVLPVGQSLIEIKSIGSMNIYVMINTDEYYTVTIDGTPSTTITGFKSYHLSVVEHYIICFNEVNAMVFDINGKEKVWQKLTDLAYIPTTKRIVGSQETEYPANGLTKSYKEEYIWSNESQPNLPVDLTGEVVLNTSKKKIDWTIPETGTLTDYRILRPLNAKIKENDLFSTARGIVCIGRDDHFLISYDEGNTFEREWYPEHGQFLQVASISNDGQYFFFVASDAVYRCNLADKSWSVIYHLDSSSSPIGVDFIGVNNICHFLTGDIFTFVLYKATTKEVNIWWKGPMLFNVSELSNNRLSYSTFSGIDLSARGLASTDVDRKRIRIMLSSDATYSGVAAVLPSTDNSKERLCLCFPAPKSRNINDVFLCGYNTQDVSTLISPKHFAIDSLTVNKWPNTPGPSPLDNRMTIRGLAYQNNQSDVFEWAEVEITVFVQLTYSQDLGIVYSASTSVSLVVPPLVLEYTGIFDGLGFPYRLTGGWIDNYTVYNSDATTSARIPAELNNRKLTWTFGDYFYMQIQDTIYTNRLTSNDFATIIYNYSSESNLYIDVPNLSYSDTELYMSFSKLNLLKITANVRDGIDIKFNLPSINDHSFTAPITGLLNISTTELAIFFTNKIVVCTKVADELLGYRYDYYNTKLSTGIRLGDGVINTLDGASTLFPTRRGLAIMNYQAYMNTSDQVLQFITDTVKVLWEDYYNKSTTIKLLQMKYYLFISNGTKEILMFDFRTQSWWRWTVPIEVKELLTDQQDLRILSTYLFVFKDNNRYKDRTDLSHEYIINWHIVSQPLHMSAPNHYKNIKQLVFQLVDTSEMEQSISAQIKLYRKKITITEPEIVVFNIDELRTFVKRFNYWKINELQWGLMNDEHTVTPARLKLNGLSVKYEIGEEVR